MNDQAIAEDDGIVGYGKFRYRVEDDWAKLPEGRDFLEVADIGVDRQDRVYVFNRGEHPMMIFDRDGNFLRSWGEGLFPHAHGVDMGPDDSIYLTDDGDHTVRKCTLAGKVLLEIGVPGKPAPFMSGDPFHRCTHTALSPQGDIYVSDGYGNARVHKYAPDGRHLMSWGEPGTDPGQFNLVHNVCCDHEGWVYVADRENHRIQVFSGDGKYEAQWNNLHRPCGMYMEPGPDPVFYIGELGPMLSSNRRIPNLGPRMSIVDNTGALLGRIGGCCAGLGCGQFVAPHGIAVDSRGDVYIGEVAHTAWSAVFPDTPRPSPVRSLRKLIRLD
jgi:hypothetical protein